MSRATGGDLVEIRAKRLFVNGMVATEPHASFTDPSVFPSGPFLPEPYRVMALFSSKRGFRKLPAAASSSPASSPAAPPPA